MASEHLQQIVGRAVLDPNFREELFTNPDSAIKPYNLSKDEIQFLKNFNRVKLDDLAKDVEGVISKLGLGIGGLGGFGS
jgi:hypothetical protein